MAADDERKPVSVDWREALNPLASYFDSDIRRWLRRRARAVSKDSLWRHEGVERAFDIARGFLEKNVHFRSRSLEFIKEKLTDYGDYWATMLYVRDGGEPALRDQLRTLFTEAEKRIVAADDPKAQAEKVKGEIASKKEALEELESFRNSLEPDPKPPPTRPLKSLKKRLYGTKKKPGPLPKASKATGEALGGVNDALEGWLTRKGVSKNGPR